MKIAVIPARGGSKRIPRKNVKDFCGKPMIAWSIDAAKESGVFDHIIVSTDDAEIAQVAKKYGAELPFMRPKELADDQTPTRPIVIHAIEMVEKLFGKADYVCCLYATAPFVRAVDLKKGIDMLIAEECDFTFTVTSFPFPIQRAIRIDENDRVEMFNPEHRNTRSQDLEEAYHDAGQFYWGKRQAFIDNIPTFSSASIPIILPRWRVQDIDTNEDWDTAELLHNASSESFKSNGYK